MNSWSLPTNLHSPAASFDGRGFTVCLQRCWRLGPLEASRNRNVESHHPLRSSPLARYEALEPDPVWRGAQAWLTRTTRAIIAPGRAKSPRRGSPARHERPRKAADPGARPANPKRARRIAMPSRASVQGWAMETMVRLFKGDGGLEHYLGLLSSFGAEEIQCRTAAASLRGKQSRR